MSDPAQVPKRGPLFWVLLLGGGGSAACCLLTALGLAAASVLGEAADPASPGTEQRGGGTWIPAGEVGRSAGLTQPLVGGRWVYQSGGSADTVVARAGSTEWVQRNTSGSLYAFNFEDDGSYTFEWASAVTLYGATSRSSCTEKGDWSLNGSQLTLEPKEQRATYVSSAGLSQTKEDVDLSARTYDAVDIALEGIVAAGAPAGRFAGFELKGPAAKFDVSRERYELDLQRL